MFTRRQSISLISAFHAAITVVLFTSSASAQIVRSKKPDRGVYQPPSTPRDVAPTSDLDSPDPPPLLPQPAAEIRRERPNHILDARGTDARVVATQGSAVEAGERLETSPRSQPRGGPLVEARLDESGGYHRVDVGGGKATREILDESLGSQLRQVSHHEVRLTRPSARLIPSQSAAWTQPGSGWEHDGSMGPIENHGGPMEYSGDGCGCETCDAGLGGGCDGYLSPGRGSICGLGGGCGCNACGGAALGDIRNGRICMDCDQWFGSVELLLMFRDGIRMPSLVTDGGTNVLAGNRNEFDKMTAGGRLTLGTWLDSSQCRSLVFRGWYGGHQSYGFETDNLRTPTIARPFLNVTDNAAPVQDRLLVAAPQRSNGSIAVNADSDVYGGDVSVRQFWVGGLGATIDVLYGYQYMGLRESLSIDTNSVVINQFPTPVGTVQSVRDSFEADNQFHGGQLGLAMRYQENCWTFNGLVKTGFGAIRRTADLAGQTTTMVGNDSDTSNEGFLVQSTNSGKRTNSTFGWVPELDLTLGWHRYRRFDVTAGYHLMAMTDALRVFDTVDPDLAVNSATNPTGQQRPELQLSYDTFFVHGIHFGLQYHY